MIYTSPPLPFMGNKRNMLKHIKQVLETMRADGVIDGESIFIDVFGGSVLVAHKSSNGIHAIKCYGMTMTTTKSG